MINANKERLLTFFQGQNQFEIPFFQRAYVWSDENWSVFLEHLNNEQNAHHAGQNSEHFLGTIITKQKDSQKLGEHIVHLIDGQQRLTTISIFLKALADTVVGDLINLKNQLNQYLWFEDSYGNRRYRMIHSKIDEANFLKVMENPSSIKNTDTSAIILGYQYFHSRLKNLDDTQRNELQQILLNKFPVISMLLDRDDDEQEIFDTINSLGVRLTIGELLKNHLFKEPELINLYEDQWLAVFGKTEQQVEYWSTERSSGRAKRDNMELLLYCFLIIETKKEIRLERLFFEYKNYLKEKTLADKKAFLIRLSEMAKSFAEIPQGKDLHQISFSETDKRFYHLIENLEITTILPLVLYLKINITDKNDLFNSYSLLESFLALRQICKLTTKNYNNVFIQIIRQLEAPADATNRNSIDRSSTHLREILSSYNDDGNRIPKDVEVKSAFQSNALSNKQAGEILFIITLKESDSKYSDSKSQSSLSLSVEHIMPKDWKENWPQAQFSELEIFERNQKLLTLGNLTLITKNLNSKLRNQAWDDKKKTLKDYSTFKITTEYLDIVNWNEKSIEERGLKLAESALEIWKF